MDPQPLDRRDRLYFPPDAWAVRAWTCSAVSTVGLCWDRPGTEKHALLHSSAADNFCATNGRPSTCPPDQGEKKPPVSCPAAPGRPGDLQFWGPAGHQPGIREARSPQPKPAARSQNAINLASRSLQLENGGYLSPDLQIFGQSPPLPGGCPLQLVGVH